MLWEEKQNILWGSYNFYYEDEFDITYHEDKAYKLCKKEYDNVESPELEVNPVTPSMGPEFPSDLNGDGRQFIIRVNGLPETEESPVVPDIGPEFSSDENGDGPAIAKVELERLRFSNQTAGLFLTAGGAMSSCTPGNVCLMHGVSIDNHETNVDIDGAWSLQDGTKLCGLQVADSLPCNIVKSLSDGHNASPTHLDCSINRRYDGEIRHTFSLRDLLRNWLLVKIKLCSFFSGRNLTYIKNCFHRIEALPKGFHFLIFDNCGQNPYRFRTN